jgi:predicted DNA-binding WGR domain protein
MTRRFELVDGRSNKFWEISVEGSAVRTTYGRIGTAGQTAVKEEGTSAAAAKLEAKLVQEKTKKGYVEVGAPAAPAARPEKKTAARPAKAKKAKEPAPGGALRAELAALLAQPDRFFESSAFGECSVVEGTPEMVVHYEAAPNGEAWRRFFREVDWLLAEADGGLVGAWSHGGEPVVLELDNEGSLRVTGATLRDHFVARNPAGRATIARAAAAAGLSPPASDDARSQHVARHPSPGARLEALMAALKFEGSAVVRPLDRSPVAIALPDGSVVVVCSEDVETAPADYDANVAFVLDGSALRFTRAADLPVRSFLSLHAAGVSSEGRAVFVRAAEDASVLTYDPANDAWSRGAVLPRKLERAGVLVLGDGCVLVAGGDVGYPNKSAAVQLYDPRIDRWRELPGKLSVARAAPALLEIEPGQVLVVGGETKPDAQYRTDSDACDVVSVADGTVAALACAPAPLSRPAALRVGERILCTSQNGVAAWLDATARTWSAAVPGADGCLPVATPRGVRLFGAQQQVTAIDATGARPAGTTRLPRNTGSAAVPLRDGRVLLLGGDLFHNHASEPELWDPAIGAGAPLPGLEKKLAKQERDLERYRAKSKR